MSKISIILSGPSYNDYSIDYAIEKLASIFLNSEIIISTNDRNLISVVENLPHVDKIIFCSNTGELPSLKFQDSKDKHVNNNINKQRDCCLQGVKAAKYDLVLRLRTDQLLLDNSILELWENIDRIPQHNEKKGRIITSSIFSINPHYSERMPYHISDMLQFGYKDDLISYFSAPVYPFDYSTWYERHPHHPSSNRFERAFRSKYAVEQWLALHYIFKNENAFPISYHNHWDDDIIVKFEQLFTEYFIIAHPKDINLRAPKFSSYESYYNTQCYSTNESISLLAKAHPEANFLVGRYPAKGMNKKYFSRLMPIIYSPVSQFIIGKLTPKYKNKIKELLNKI